MDSPVLTCREVSFHTRRKNALREVSFSIGVGKIVGLFGPMDSGKSLLLQIAAGRLTPTGGKISVCGNESGREIRADVSYLPEWPVSPKQGRISTLMRQYADFFPDFYPIRCQALLSRFDLPVHGKLKTLTTAQIQQLGLCLVLSRAVPLYLLDQPLSAVNPDTRTDCLREVLAGRPAGSSVLIASSSVAPLEPVVDEALFLWNGRLCLSGTAAGIRAERGKSLSDVYAEGFEWE